MNNQQLYNYISDLIKKQDASNYVTSFPKDGRQIYVALINKNKKEIQALTLHHLKDLVEQKINEVA